MAQCFICNNPIENPKSKLPFCLQCTIPDFVRAADIQTKVSGDSTNSEWIWEQANEWTHDMIAAKQANETGYKFQEWLEQKHEFQSH